MKLRTGRRKPHPDAPKDTRATRPLILPADLARAAQRGEKTTIRLPVTKRPLHLQPGDATPVLKPVANRSPGQPARLCRLLVVAVEQQTLGDMTVTDARNEGYRTTGDFYDAWREQHRLHLRPDRRDLLERLADTPAGGAPAQALHPGLPARRLSELLRHLERQAYACRTKAGWDITDAGADVVVLDGVDPRARVWVLTVKPDDRDRTLYLATAGHGDEHGLTENASQALTDPVLDHHGRLRHVPMDAVDIDRLDGHWKRDALERHADAATRQARAERVTRLIA